MQIDPLAPANPAHFSFSPIGPSHSLLGESPVWSVAESRLYYVDIGGQRVLRVSPSGEPAGVWQLGSQPGCIALLEDGGLLIAGREGLLHLDPHSGALRPVAPPPFDPKAQRFNDGKPDARGRLWVGTIDDARKPAAGLYCYESGSFRLVAQGITNSNGLAWSPDQRTMYWSDTKAHEIYAFDFDAEAGVVSGRRLFHSFAPRQAGQSLEEYGGRPDGAAVDAEGVLWVAMYEGQRLVRLSPGGELLQSIPLPVRCPTMPSFGGADLKTLYVTTASEGRPTQELAAQPWAGLVLQTRVQTPGLPPHFARL